jgi:hypothetical protein
MGIPLVALQVQKPPDMMAQMGEMVRVQALLQGQKLQQAELEGRQLQNQQT